MELRGPRGMMGREIDPADATRLLNQVLDAGINFIDTSPDYGDSEELIGKSISHRRDEFFLASKCGCPVNQPAPSPGERPPHVFTRENVRAAVEQSLAPHEHRSYRRGAVPHQPLSFAARRERLGRRARGAAAGGQGPLHRHVWHAAEPGRSHRDGRVRRVSDPVLRGRAGTRGMDHQGLESGRRHGHSWGRGARYPGRASATAP